MNYQSEQLFGIISAVRKRRNLLTVLRGAAIAITVTTLMLVLTGMAAYRYRFSSATLISLRIFALLSIVAAVYFGLVRPLRRKISDTQLARLVEEKHPGLEERLVSAVEVCGTEPSTQASTAIFERLVDDAETHAREIQPSEIVPNKRFWQFGGAAAASLLLFIAALVFGPREIRSGVAQLVAPASSVAASNALRIEVKPGTARVPKGSDQKLLASLINFNAEQATIFLRKAGAKDDQWAGVPMEPAKDEDKFQHIIFNIQEDTEYFVESAGCRSEVYKLTVVDLPYVKQIDQTQFFPSYTGQAPKTIEDAPDVAVLAGTTVKLTARLTNRAKAARLILADGTKIEMEDAGDNAFAASLTVNKNTSYHIELTSPDGDVYNGSNEYDITVLEDAPPTVTFEKPGRDTKATSVEEILALAKAEDDYGVLSLDLHFSINGGEEKKVDLQKLRGESAKTLSGAHTFFLEEYGLQPGDLVSYYAKARDAQHETTSDIYFIEIKPFEKEFKQNQQSGGGGGGTGAASCVRLAGSGFAPARARLRRSRPLPPPSPPSPPPPSPPPPLPPPASAGAALASSSSGSSRSMVSANSWTCERRTRRLCRSPRSPSSTNSSTSSTLSHAAAIARPACCCAVAPSLGPLPPRFFFFFAFGIRCPSCSQRRKLAAAAASSSSRSAALQASTTSPPFSGSRVLAASIVCACGPRPAARRSASTGR